MLRSVASSSADSCDGRVAVNLVPHWHIRGFANGMTCGRDFMVGVSEAADTANDLVRNYLSAADPYDFSV